MAAREELTAGEIAVWSLFTGQQSGGYQAHGCCANPTCESPGQLTQVCGSAPSARVCLICFEFVFNCKHPSRDRIEKMRAQ